ncbi:MAG: SAM-dependent methyltransferase [Solirubrobacteraceae bacterium]
MKIRAPVSAERLRGGFYTPRGLVELCLQRAAGLLEGETAIRMLEPSAGDGAFVRGLAGSGTGIDERVCEICAIEVIPEEAAKAELSLRSSGVAGRVVRRSALQWAADTDEWFGLVVGNPPFVRYQLFSETDKAAIEQLGARLGLAFRGVANLWIPVLLGSLARLQPNGVLAVVLPTECFTGFAAGAVRDWLACEVDELRFDLLPRGSFPGVVQEVAVLSGRRAPSLAGARSRSMRIVEHGRGGERRAWSYRPSAADRSWTGSLLDPRHSEALEVAGSLTTVTRLDRVARLGASAITGANDFFCIDDRTRAAHELAPWARPLLARARHAPGLVAQAADHAAARVAGARTWLLDFDADAPDPANCRGANDYLDAGFRQGIADRYKCRIRDPWYRVPSIRPGSLLLSKRSHLYPRLLVNRAGLHTTDTIYRGDVLATQTISAGDLTACFHCSLTLLTVELEGRSFGGGVLELVPSEISRLAVVLGAGLGRSLGDLDRIARNGSPEDLVQATDSLLVTAGLLPRELVDLLSEARQALMGRRLHRE